MEQPREEDPEQQVEALRQFQRAALFRVAVADLTGALPLMQVSDRLTDIAELIVERALDLGWRQVTAQFGLPRCGDADSARAVNICAVGYGKLGGIELGYSSDLDLVFLHDSQGERQETTGARPIDNQLFFVRLAQRIVHLLTMHSAAGRLYEVDVRLRPSGKGGLLVTNIDAFADYQREEAWTWEHQALLLRRACHGARASSGCGSRCSPATCAASACARRCAACASGSAASSPGAMRCASTSSRIPEGSPTSSFSPSTGRSSGPPSIRRWRCTPTPSASSSRWRRPTWLRRRAWISSPARTAPTAPAPITWPSTARRRSYRRRSSASC